MRLLVLIISFFLFSTACFAIPAQVIVIRHAEKPLSGNEVSAQGCERAYLLPKFFAKNLVVNQFGKPVAIYAAKPSNVGGSIRSIQTIAPTANKLQLFIDDTYTNQDLSQIAQEILENPNFNHQTVLIAWEHGAIPALAEAFGIVLNPETQTWPDNVFDEAWVISFLPSPILTIIPENALSTDNPLGGNNWGAGPTSINPPQVSSSVATECQDNTALNGLVQKLTSPSLNF